MFRLNLFDLVLILSALQFSAIAGAEAPDANHQKYFYVDLGLGYFPIPLQFVERASSLNDGAATQRELRFSMPVADYQEMAVDREKSGTDRIYIRSVPDDFSEEVPPSESLHHTGKLAINGLTISRFRLASGIQGLQSLRDSCFDRIVAGGYYVYITSDNCELSKQLADGFIYEE